MYITEKFMEDLIADYSHEFIEDELILIERQSVYAGPRIDLLFRDKLGRLLLVEIKKGTLSREHIGQVHEYYGAIKNKKPEENLELLVIANNIPTERKRFLEELGVNFKEISDETFLKVAEKYGRVSEIKESVLEKNIFQQPFSSRSGKMTINSLSGEKGLLFHCSFKQKDNITDAIGHLKKYEELYWSINRRIRTDNYSYPLTGLINMRKRIICKCEIRRIKEYEASDHLDSTKKPISWIERQKNNPEKYLVTLIITKIEPFDYETEELRDQNGKKIGRPTQSHRTILLP